MNFSDDVPTVAPEASRTVTVHSPGDVGPTGANFTCQTCLPPLESNTVILATLAVVAVEERLSANFTMVVALGWLVRFVSMFRAMGWRASLSTAR